MALPQQPGTIFLHNEAGEPEVDVNQYHVDVPNNFPSADDVNLFCANPETGTGQQNQAKVINANDTLAFMADQYVYLCYISDIYVMNDNALYEACLLPVLAYKHRLISPAIDAKAYHVMYKE